MVGALVLSRAVAEPAPALATRCWRVAVEISWLTSENRSRSRRAACCERQLRGSHFEPSPTRRRRVHL